MTDAYEVNFDGLVGNTHNYAGLSYGNVASETHAGSQSRPRDAALQGLEKMWTLHQLGFKQALLPPQERPHLPTLRALGYQGSDKSIITQVIQDNPGLLVQVCSASCMWTANAACVTPSSDSADARLHISPANLAHKFHRSIEPRVTGRMLRRIFHDPRRFAVHAPLHAGQSLADEGAANHTRFCRRYGEPGVHLFVYGRSALGKNRRAPKTYPARQTLEASCAIARRHGLKEEQCVFAQQNPNAIDAGVFHNDVISVGNANVFLYHEDAFVSTDEVLAELRQKVERVCGTPLVELRVQSSSVTVNQAVKSYLFNSQLLSQSDGSMLLVAPSECKEMEAVRNCIEGLISADNPLCAVRYMDVRESMRNGGGPACLRQRIVISSEELALCHQGCFLTEELYLALGQWIRKFYRESLAPADLLDPQLLEETWGALQELTEIMDLGPIYDFQRVLTHEL